MIKLLLLTLLFTLSLFGDKVLYLKYNDIQKRVVRGEIFPITIKTLSTVAEYDDITYKFSSYYGLKILDYTPEREFRGKYLLDTFYFLVTQKKAKTPTITASIQAEKKYATTALKGKKLEVITLNPQENFSNIIANSFELIDYKTTSFDDKYNILIFVATASNTDITRMKFQNIIKQGIESSQNSYLDSRITYFMVIDKKVENFSFSYFNLLKNKFLIVNIPIIVEDDSVTTQTDLKPQNQSHNKMKAIIISFISFLIIIFLVIKKRYIYILLFIVPTLYVIYIMIPSKEVCIKKGSQIYLLPVDNGTIFETTKSEYRLLQEGEVKSFIKIKLHNEKIGWVKNEDICSY